MLTRLGVMFAIEAHRVPGWNEFRRGDLTRHTLIPWLGYVVRAIRARALLIHVGAKYVYWFYRSDQLPGWNFTIDEEEFMKP